MTQQFAQRATNTAPTGARNADLSDLVRILEDGQRRKLDVIAPASALRMREGNVHVEGVESQITASGVTQVDGVYRPTAVADEGISDKLRIPLAYLRRMRAENVPLLDENVNAWLREGPEHRFMLRAFRGEDGPGMPGEGVARALLSDSYKLMDNLDMLLAALDGVQQSGHPTRITGCDLSDRRMYVRVESEAVAIQARNLLRGYRSPFDGRSGDELPMISAGFVITNSEVGAGAYTITPRAVIQVCSNGLTQTQDVMRAVHLGGKQDEGVVSWSGETQRKTLELITSKTTDAVRTFLSREYVEAKVYEMEAAAGKTLDEPTKTIEHVTKSLSIGTETKDRILSHFIRGGQMTAGGVMQAVTSTAQTLTDADQAAALEALAVPALTTAAAHGSQTPVRAGHSPTPGPHGPNRPQSAERATQPRRERGARPPGPCRVAARATRRRSRPRAHKKPVVPRGAVRPASVAHRPPPRPARSPHVCTPGAHPPRRRCHHGRHEPHAHRPVRRVPGTRGR